MLEQSDELDKAFHALADATRRGILVRLSQGPASVSHLAKPYSSTLAAIHQHIQVLEASGLIVTEKIGRTRTCRIAADAVGRVEGWLSERRLLWESRFDRLGQLVESPDFQQEPNQATEKDRTSKP